MFRNTAARFAASAIVLAIASVAIVSCSSGGGTTPPPAFDLAKSLSKAWSSFELSDFVAAQATFTEVIKHASNNAEAHVGRGWCYAFRNRLDSAVTDFNTATQEDESNLAAPLGLAGCYKDYPAGNPNYQAAISNATAVIDADSEFVFSHMVTLNFRDAHLIRAECWFRMGSSHFQEAHAEVNYLRQFYPQISPLPEASTFASEQEYEYALADKIAKLAEHIAN